MHFHPQLGEHMCIDFVKYMYICLCLYVKYVFFVLNIIFFCLLFYSQIASYCQGLQVLNIALCVDISDEAIATLISLRSLRVLNVAWSLISDNTVKSLLRFCPLQIFILQGCKELTSNLIDYLCAQVLSIFPPLDLLDFAMVPYPNDFVGSYLYITVLYESNWCKFSIIPCRWTWWAKILPEPSLNIYLWPLFSIITNLVFCLGRWWMNIFLNLMVARI